MRRIAAESFSLLLACAALAGCATPTPRVPEAAGSSLPSPDWRDQVLYFVMIDRFADGDASNNDQGAGEFDPASGAHYSGGDLAGIAQRLDYIEGLGATGLWITPPVAHQWWDGGSNYGGYHGYWAENFVEVDAHFGDLATYRGLADALHARGMTLVQDVVVNHVGNFFRYADVPPDDDPARGYVPSADVRPRPAPTQWPFSLNDPRRAQDRAAAIYHWTPNIVDFTDVTQERDWQLAGLDDLETESPVVQRALRDSYAHWIRAVGVDGFRVDTAFYVPPAFFDEFIHGRDPASPGMLQVARETGRDDFHVFGEGFGLDRPFEDTQARKIDSYMRAPDGTPLLPGMINFPLYGSSLDVFARGRPPAVLAHRIGNMMAVHADPHRMATFVDNHDVDRFRAGGSEAALKQALLAMLTLPGIPVIYYGTEQGFTGQRTAMFGGGFDAGGRDHYDTSAPLYRYVQRAIALRREHRVLSRGRPRVLEASAAAPGVLAYTMRDGGDVALVLLNTADHDVLVAQLDTGLADDTVLHPVFAIEGEASPLRVDGQGRITHVLPARSGAVYVPQQSTSPARVASSARVTLDAMPLLVRDALVVSGESDAAAVQVVVDGDLERSVTVTPDGNGRWRAELDTSSHVDPQVEHSVVVWDAASGAVSARHTFRVEREWTQLAAVDDPADDDHGPDGRYRYPTDPAWTRHRPLDLRRTVVSASGGSMRIELQLRDVVSLWNAPNGFDHVAAMAFVELPGRDGGVAVMPLQNASLPDGMRWHVRARVGGWTNALFGANGASATNEGERVSPSADLRVDADADRITLTLPSSALRYTGSLSGAKVYVALWDYDGRYRGLEPEAKAHDFGGGDGSVDPLVMDDSGVIVLP